VNSDPWKNRLNRRQFLTRLSKAGICIAAACGTGLWFHDSERPASSLAAPSDTGVLDFTAGNSSPGMAIVRGSDRRATLNSALKALGGIESFVGKKDRVLLKVNAAFASPPMLSATTHPDVVSEMTRLCLQAGASTVVVTDNPINDPNSCFALSGIMDAARGAGAALFLPHPGAFRTLSVPNARLIRSWPVLLEPLKNITKVIGLAPVKDHHRSGASLTMKNWYGLLGGRRNIFHQDINTIITELALMVRPTLVVLDGTTSMITNGPTGGSLSDLKQTNTMIVSTDQVAADAFGVTLLGKSAAELPYIGKADAAGAGRADYRALNPVELSL
jgi:uncharacterized protein (DUF362 family)